MAGYTEAIKQQSDFIRIPVWEAARFMAVLNFNLNVKKADQIRDARALINFTWEDKLRKLDLKSARRILKSFPDTLPIIKKQ